MDNNVVKMFLSWKFVKSIFHYLAVSCIGGGKMKYPEKTTDLSQKP